MTVRDSQVPEKTDPGGVCARLGGCLGGRRVRNRAEPVPVSCAPGLAPVPSGQGRTWGGSQSLWLQVNS